MRRLSHSPARAPRDPRRTAVALSVATLLGVASPLEAQLCLGTADRSHVTYQYEQLSVGSSQGGSIALVGGHFATGLEARARSISNSTSGLEGALRFTALLGQPRFRVCPTLAIGVVRDETDLVQRGSIASTTVGAAAGVGAAYEQHVGREVYVAPYARVGYAFHATAYTLSGLSGSSDVTGDTLSGVTVDYGVSAHYRQFFVAWQGTRLPEATGSRPGAARFVLGATFRPRKP